MRNTAVDKFDSEDKGYTTKQRLSNEELSKLYPNPKTYEEKLQDRKVINAKILAKQPRHVAVHTAVRLFVVVFLGAAIISAAPQIVMWNVISGVFWVTLLALFWLGIVAWQYSEISSVLYKKEISVGSFFGSYLLIIAPSMIIACYIINERVHDYSMVVMYSFIFLIHFLCVYLLLKYLSSQR